MHANAKGESTGEEWDMVFDRAQHSSLFRGGSAKGKRWTVGKDADTLSEGLAGFMRFDSESVDELLEYKPILRSAPRTDEAGHYRSAQVSSPGERPRQ